jgi:hypothetical protein
MTVIDLATWREIHKQLDSRRRWRRIRTWSLVVGMGVVLGLAFARAGIG